MHTLNSKSGLIKLARQEGRVQVEINAIPMGRLLCSYQWSICSPPAVALAKKSKSADPNKWLVHQCLH